MLPCRCGTDLSHLETPDEGCRSEYRGAGNNKCESGHAGASQRLVVGTCHRQRRRRSGDRGRENGGKDDGVIGVVDFVAIGSRSCRCCHACERRPATEIRHSAAVVVEFTEAGVGLGIEVGYAAALDIPVFVLVPPEAEVSTTLDGVSTEVLRYSDDDTLSTAAARFASRISQGARRP